jgi:GGDEF domain-containing protein
MLTDPETGLLAEAYFRIALDARIASARRHLRPVAVALLEVVQNVGCLLVTPTDPPAVAAVVRETLRDADTVCRLKDGSFALILEDTPELGAVRALERVRSALVGRFSHSTMWAGVACYPAHAFSTEEVLTQGRLALLADEEWNQDRIEVATAG